MATTEYTIDASFVGTTIGPPDGGAIISLAMNIPPPVYEMPCWNGQIWTSGYFVLRGEGDVRDAVCISPQTNGGAFSRPTMIIHGSIAYAGALQIVALPKGSVWSLTLTDALGRRAVDAR